MAMVVFWLCRVVPRQVSEPLVSKRVVEVSSPSPKVTYRFRVDGMVKIATEVSEAEPGRGFEEVSCHLRWWSFTEASQAV